MQYTCDLCGLGNSGMGVTHENGQWVFDDEAATGSKEGADTW